MSKIKNKVWSIVFMVLFTITFLALLDTLHFMVFKEKALADVIKYEDFKNGKVGFEISFNRKGKRIHLYKIKKKKVLNKIGNSRKQYIYYSPLWKNMYYFEKAMPSFWLNIFLFSLTSFLFFRGFIYYKNM